MSAGCISGRAWVGASVHALTFFALAAYIVVEGIRLLVVGDVPGASVVGMILLAISIVVMPLLARVKCRVGEQLGRDSLILADAAKTRIRVLLSILTLLGLVGFGLTGAACVDSVAGFVIAVFAVNEGREAWRGKLVKEDDDDDKAIEALKWLVLNAACGCLHFRCGHRSAIAGPSTGRCG